MLDTQFSCLLVYTLVALTLHVYAHEEHHGHGHGSMGEMAPPPAKTVNSAVPGADYHALDSYYLWEEDKMLLYFHIVTMVVSWVFVLPLGE